MRIRAALALAVFAWVLSPANLKADAQQDQQACMNDAMTICGQFIPDRERVAACLFANRGHVSTACRAALSRFNPRPQANRTTASVR